MQTASTARTDARSGQGSRTRRFLGPLPVAASVAVAFLSAGVWHLTLGAVAVPIPEVLDSLLGRGSDFAPIILEIRLPRLCAAMIIGAGLAVAGTLTQTVTANPLAAPDILGITAGATFLVVAGLTVVPTLGEAPSLVLALAGAVAAAAVVLGLSGVGRRGSTKDLKVVLVGVTVSAFLLSLTQGMVVLHDNNAESVIFWLVGGVNYAQWSELAWLAPVVLAGIVAAMLQSRQLNLLLLGEEMASALGASVPRTRLLVSLLIVCLAGAAVAVGGPIGFIGLVIPHMTKFIVGSDHRVALPIAALLGALILMLADAIGHLINPPYEVPAGVVIAVIGAPYFVWLARRSERRTA